MQPKSFYQKYQFWLFLLLAVLVHQIPFVSIPFKWLESYFHEISHGIAALISGGSIIQIQLFPNGAGLCTTRGGWNFLISFMGYAGASIWGVMIYSIATINQRASKVFSLFLLVILGTSIIFWVRDLLTLVIVGSLIVIFVLPFHLKKQKIVQPLMQLSGMLILLNSVYSPTFLFGHAQKGDSAALFSATGIPEIFWVFSWLAIALYGLYWLACRSR